MCEACKLRKMHDATDWEATTILRMFIERMHAQLTSGGGAVLEIELNKTEMDWLCEWEADNVDIEDDDPPEDDGSAEAGEQSEADCRERFGHGETATAFVKTNGTNAIEPYRPV